MRTRPDISDDDLPSGNREPLPDGEYDFAVKSATEKKSSSGNDMIELVLTVWAPDGSERLVWDYLVDQDSSEWKTRNFAKATGLIHCYESGSFTEADCINANGRVVLRTQPARIVNGKTYEARNGVKHYVDPEIASAPKGKTLEGAGRKHPKKELAESLSIPDSDVPF